jgi:predicted nucleic acid-binding protein
VRAAFDTNVLASAEGINGQERRDDAVALIRRLPPEAAVIPVQVLGELFNLLTGKGARSCSEARGAMLSWRDTFPTVATSPETMLMAADLSTDHQMGIWDAVILSAAAQAGCRLLLSEDLHEGFTWGGVTVVNPFSSPRHALLQALLGEEAEEPNTP